MPRRLLLAGLLALLSGAWAQGISYTVQVLAVSDQEAALSVQRDLLADRFPAYVVRAAVAGGDLYRVRVGAFANRTAAALYAELMEPVEGSQPLPALAEGIPAGVMPLAPRVLAQVGEEEFTVFEWGSGLALRFQPDADAPATYRVYSDDESFEFEAWRAAPAADGEGIVRVRNLPLWPSTWQEDAAEVREAYMQQIFRNVAGDLGVEAAELEGYRLRPVFGPPYLVILERLAPQSSSGQIIGVAETGDEEEPEGFGPDSLALGEGEYPVAVEPLLTVDPEAEPAEREFGGDGWLVSAQGEFFLLTPAEGGTGWRAGVGTPLWSDGVHLLSRADSGHLLYDFTSR